MQSQKARRDLAGTHIMLTEKLNSLSFKNWCNKSRCSFHIYNTTAP